MVQMNYERGDMNELALFTGVGGGLLATKHLLNWRTVCYVEKDRYAVNVLKARIQDGLLDDAPIWDDVTTFDGQPWRGCVDIISAGFPCQPFSKSGKRNGIIDKRNGWPATIRIIREIRPTWVFLENSPNLLSPFRKRRLPAYMWHILGDLAQSGYDARWGCLSASTFGASHKRKRLWIVAHPACTGWPVFLRSYKENCTQTYQYTQKRGVGNPTALDAALNRLSQLEEELGEPSVFRTNDGLAYRVDRLRATGNGQVPIVAAKAWQMLTQNFLPKVNHK